jgi:hypothetical protein
MQTFRQLSRRVFQRIFTGDRHRLREMVRVLPHDAISSIDMPIFETPGETKTMTGEERVVGLEINGDFRAYPLNILSVHEVVNDVVGGELVSVTWSPLSYSASVYKRVVAGCPLIFGVSGGILRNVMIMYDRQTGTYWNQLTGDGFSGALAGMTLESVPSCNTTWERWLMACPSTSVLSKQKSPYGHYEEDHMSDYYTSEKTGIRPATHQDNRLPEKVKVLGLMNMGKPRVYLYSLLEAAKVLHDNLDGRSFAVLNDSVSQSAVAYDAEIDGVILSFYESEGSIIDYRTGSRWSLISGKAEEGPLQGKRLQPVAAVTAYWFAWADHFPDTEIYTLPTIH